MFNVNLDDKKVLIDSDLNEFYEGLKIDYTAFYRGIVVDNLDPDKKGRVKVRIPQIYGTNNNVQTFVPTTSIPWATCAVNNASNDSGTFLPPNIGDTVFVTFEGGDYKHPIYFGGIYTNRSEDDNTKGVGSKKVYDDEIIPVVSDDLPLEVTNGTERVLYKSLKGAVIYMDDRDGAECIKITDQSGQSIIMENLSDEALKRRGNALGTNTNSQVVITNNAGDSVSLTQGQVSIKSKNIILETDNLKQTEYSLSDELDEANTILGVSDESTKYNVTFIFKNAFFRDTKYAHPFPMPEHDYIDLPETAKCYIDIFDTEGNKLVHKDFIGDTIVIPLEAGSYYYNAGSDIGDLFTSIGTRTNNYGDTTGSSIVETTLNIIEDDEVMIFLRSSVDPWATTGTTSISTFSFNLLSSVPPYDDIGNYGPYYYYPATVSLLDENFNNLSYSWDINSSSTSELPRRPYRIKIEHPSFKTLITEYMYLRPYGGTFYLEPLEPHPNNGGNL